MLFFCSKLKVYVYMGRCIQRYTVYVSAYPEATCIGCPCPGAGSRACRGLHEERLGLPHWTGPVPAGSAAASVQGTAEPNSDAGGASVETRMRKGKMLSSSEGKV